MTEMENPQTEEENDDFGGQPMTNAARIPTVVLLDISGSMSGKPIKQLNKAIKQYKDEIGEDYKTEKAVDISIVTFGDGDATIEQSFAEISDWQPTELSAGGNTPMCEALIKGVNHMEEYRNKLNDNNTPTKKGLVWVLTDGKPTDDNKSWKNSNTDTYWDKAKSLVKQGTDKGDLLFYFVGIGPKADMDKLEELANAAPDADRFEGERAQTLELDEGMFQEFFQVLSESQRAQERGDDNTDINTQE